MPRVCNRAGCGKALLKSDGRPDHHRHFCGEACIRADKREKMQDLHARLKTGRCPTCGHISVSDASKIPCVKPHKRDHRPSEGRPDETGHVNQDGALLRL